MTRKRPRKAEPPKDFAKKKQKVGKGKRAPENATVATFKSQSIVIPSQLEQRTDQPTTHRKLTLQVSVLVHNSDYGLPSFIDFSADISQWDISVQVSEGSSPRALSNGACNVIIDKTVMKPHPPKLSP